MKQTLIYDIEIYRNYLLISFLNADTGNVRHLEATDSEGLDVTILRAILQRYRLVSFNGNHFDLPLIAAALTDAPVARIKAIADKIILNNLKYWQLDLQLPTCDHIDLIDVAPGIASLKIYGGRLHCQRLQDLPIPPDALITPEQRPLLRQYCENDLHTTLALFRKLEPQLALRETMSAEYGIDLRSKSDAQIAEAVIKHEVEKRKGTRLEKLDPFRLAGKTFQYTPPEFVAFTTQPLREVLDTVTAATFTIGSNGTVQMPKPIAELKIDIGDSSYQMGIGGLHSTEKSVAHFADDDTLLVDRDVTSYYPNIILNCGFRPAHMGEHFTKVYRQMVEQRVNAKHKVAEIKARIAELEMELKNAN